jgi:hypothetical protein
VTKFPFKDAEQKRAYMESFRLKKREEKEEARIDMLATVNKTIMSQNRFDINGLLLLDTDLRFYKSFGDYKRSNPSATFPEFLAYQSDFSEWLNERKSERFLAVQKAIEYLTQYEPKTQVWRKMFPRFFEKYQQKEEVSQS